MKKEVAIDIFKVIRSIQYAIILKSFSTIADISFFPTKMLAIGKLCVYAHVCVYTRMCQR